MKNIDSLLKKREQQKVQTSKCAKVEIVSQDEAIVLSGGDKEYKPIYDEIDTLDYPQYQRTPLFNFFNKLF